MSESMVKLVVAASIVAGVWFFWRLAGKDDQLVDWPEKAMAALLPGVPLGFVFSVVPLVILAAILGPIGR